MVHKGLRRVGAVLAVLIWLGTMVTIWGQQRLVDGGFRELPNGSLHEQVVLGLYPFEYATQTREERYSYTASPTGIGGSNHFLGRFSTTVWHPFGLASIVAVTLFTGAATGWGVRRLLSNAKHGER
jgi:hypothetical protein